MRISIEAPCRFTLCPQRAIGNHLGGSRICEVSGDAKLGAPARHSSCRSGRQERRTCSNHLLLDINYDGAPRVAHVYDERVCSFGEAGVAPLRLARRRQSGRCLTSTSGRPPIFHVERLNRLAISTLLDLRHPLSLKLRFFSKRD